MAFARIALAGLVLHLGLTVVREAMCGLVPH